MIAILIYLQELFKFKNLTLPFELALSKQSAQLSTDGGGVGGVVVVVGGVVVVVVGGVVVVVADQSMGR